MADDDSSGEKTKVVLHWLDDSRAQRVVWLLEECTGIDYTIEVYKRQEMQAPPELKKVHPLGKSPVVTLTTPNRSEPIVLAESGTIFEYLVEYFAPHLIPKKFEDGKEGKVGGETESWLRYRYLMHYAEGSFMPLLVDALLFGMLKNGSQIPFFLKPITRGIAGRIDSLYLNPNFKRHFGYLESQLASSPEGGEYLCGTELTAADILMSFPLIMGKSKQAEIGSFPKLEAYTKRLEQNEVYLRSVKKVEEVTGEPMVSKL